MRARGSLCVCVYVCVPMCVCHAYPYPQASLTDAPVKFMGMALFDRYDLFKRFRIQHGTMAQVRGEAFVSFCFF